MVGFVASFPGFTYTFLLILRQKYTKSEVKPGIFQHVPDVQVDRIYRKTRPHASRLPLCGIKPRNQLLRYLLTLVGTV